MPDDDLLRYVMDPTPYSAWWPWIAAALVLLVIAWYSWLFIATTPKRRFGDARLIRVTRHLDLYARRAHGARRHSGRARVGPETEPRA